MFLKLTKFLFFISPMTECRRILLSWRFDIKLCQYQFRLPFLLGWNKVLIYYLGQWYRQGFIWFADLVLTCKPFIIRGIWRRLVGKIINPSDKIRKILFFAVYLVQWKCMDKWLGKNYQNRSLYSSLDFLTGWSKTPPFHDAPVHTAVKE